MKSGNIIVNLSQYLFLIGLGVLVVVLMVIVAIVAKSKREAIK